MLKKILAFSSALLFLSPVSALIVMSPAQTEFSVVKLTMLIIFYLELLALLICFLGLVIYRNNQAKAGSWRYVSNFLFFGVCFQFLFIPLIGYFTGSVSLFADFKIYVLITNVTLLIQGSFFIIVLIYLRKNKKLKSKSLALKIIKFICWLMIIVLVLLLLFFLFFDLPLTVVSCYGPTCI